MGEVTGISHDNHFNVTSELSISQGYPNPFNATVNFDYSVPIGFTNKIDISIYNILGKRVCILLSEINEPGPHSIQWDGNDLNNRAVASGIYYIKLKGGGHQIIRKVLLVK
jgi:flagellar hook assembly protein FlgD